MTSQLKDFQEATVGFVSGKLLSQRGNSSRILVADEVGLGKTLVARGVIQRFYDHYKKLGRQSLNVIYICSNQTIAHQNINRLNIEKQKGVEQTRVNRINDLAITDFQKQSEAYLNIIALSPNTSFNVSEGGGTKYERAMLYHILCQHETFRHQREKIRSRFFMYISSASWQALTHKGSEYCKKLRPEIVAQFNERLHLHTSEFKALMSICEERENSSADFSKRKRKVIGSLRKLLASVCVEYLHPDLIVLDEFQRFKSLLAEENSDIALITHTLFNNPKIKLLLLSATPFKMFTIQSEIEHGESHFDEFKFIIRFLLNDDSKYQKFIRLWSAYSRALLHLKEDDWSLIKEQKREVEAVLRSIICRTERIGVSDDKNTLVRMRSKAICITPEEINNFIASDSLAKVLATHYNHIAAPVEYCKSAPFPFSFLDGYQLNHYVQRAIKENKIDFIDCLRDSSKAFLNPSKVNSYESVDMPNAKVQYLIRESIEAGGADLLWIPPSFPYYQFEGPFEGKESFSKVLVFSAWQMVPKMISGLLSYECERVTIKAVNKSATQSVKAPHNRLKYDKDFNNLSFYALLYPCITLGNLWRPDNSVKPMVELLDDLSVKISQLLAPIQIQEYITNPEKEEDDRWILIYMLLLDRKYHMPFIKQLEKEEDGQDLDWTWLYSDEEASNAHHYYDKVFSNVLFADNNALLPASQLRLQTHDTASRNNSLKTALLELGLGKPPKDIGSQLAILTLGGPAICTYRALKDYIPKDRALAFFGAFRIGDSFRKFYNKPETTAVIDKFSTTGAPYWKSVVHYGAYGNLQSMLDEYIPVVIDREGVWDKDAPTQVLEIIDTLARDIIGLTTSNIHYQTKNSFLGSQKAKTLRCHYAVSLNEKSDTQKGVEKRNTNVRNAFNSPFRPFVLSTTSVGQEGLDFHLYCRKILHWNLPANPIDFEQREGRINRFKSLAIRQTIALKYRNHIDTNHAVKLWEKLFQVASAMEKGDKSDLVPYWHVEPLHIFIERHVPITTYSRDAVKLDNLLKTISVYRVALGQPRQEELVNFLLTHLEGDRIKEIQEDVLINLSPFTYNIAADAHALSLT